MSPSASWTYNSKKKVDTIMREHDMGRAILLPVDFQEFQVILGSNKSYSR